MVPYIQFLAISQDELIILWEYHLDNPNTCVKLKIFHPTQLPVPLYSGEMSHHVCESGKFPDVTVCHTISNMSSPSRCQWHDSSVCQPKGDSTWKSIQTSVCPSSIPSIQSSANFMVKIPMMMSCQP